jgi:hypothetical protein
MKVGLLTLSVCLSVNLSLRNAALLAPTVIIGNKKDVLEREEIKVEGLERKRLKSKGLKEFVSVTVPPAVALLN